MNDDEDMWISAEVAYWATAPMECWSCTRITRVTALIAVPPVFIRDSGETYEEPDPLFVTGPALADQSLRELAAINANVWDDHSYTAGESYLMNHCQHCNAKIGDHYVTQIEGPLLPFEDAKLGDIQLASMKEPLLVKCTGYSQSSRLDDVLSYKRPAERGH